MPALRLARQHAGAASSRSASWSSDDAVGTKVFDARGRDQRSSPTKANGRKRVLRLHTKAGYTLDVTPDHLVWRASGVGDAAASSRPATCSRAISSTWHRTRGVGRRRDRSQPISRRRHLAGWLQGDGFVGQYDHGTNRSLTIEFLTVTDAEHAWVLEHLDVVFPDVHRQVRDDHSAGSRRSSGGGSGSTARCSGRSSSAGGCWPGAQSMTVPAELLHRATAGRARPTCAVSSRPRGPSRCAIERQSSALDLVGEVHVRGLQQLLSRFGIFARVRRKDDARPDRLGTWSLEHPPVARTRSVR